MVKPGPSQWSFNLYFVRSIDVGRITARRPHASAKQARKSFPATTASQCLTVRKNFLNVFARSGRRCFCSRNITASSKSKRIRRFALWSSPSSTSLKPIGQTRPTRRQHGRVDSEPLVMTQAITQPQPGAGRVAVLDDAKGFHDARQSFTTFSRVAPVVK